MSIIGNRFFRPQTSTAGKHFEILSAVV